MDRVCRWAVALAGTAVVLCTAVAGCRDDTPPPRDRPATFIGEQTLWMSELSEEPWFPVLESVEAHDLFSFLSGSFGGGGHTFAVLYLDPVTQEFWVKGPHVARRFPASGLDEAFTAYSSLLFDKGYSMPGRERPAADGQELVVLDTNALFPDEKENRSHFSREQWGVLQADLGGWQGFTYLSGVGTDSRDYPLLVGVGWQDSARLRVMGKQTAQEFDFHRVDEAFEAYRTLVSPRIRDPRKHNERETRSSPRDGVTNRGVSFPHGVE